MHDKNIFRGESRKPKQTVKQKTKRATTFVERINQRKRPRKEFK